MVRVIIETSAWVSYFRSGDSSIADEVDRLLATNEAVLVGVVYAELVRGFRTSLQPQSLEADLDLLPYLETTHETWKRTGQLLADLQRRGEMIPFPDAVIAAQALENGLPLFTLDRHFDRVEGLALHEIN